MGELPAARVVGATPWRQWLDHRRCRKDHDAQRHTLRVIAWPAFVNRRQNPYNALLYDALAALGVRVDDFTPLRLIFGRYQIWHVHWPESILNLPRLWQAIPLTLLLRFLLVVARARGIKIVWTAHNLRSHEGLYPRVEARLWRTLLGRVDAVIALTGAGRDLTLQHFPCLRARPAFVIPHGSYRTAYPMGQTRDTARRQLGLPEGAQVLVSLGQLRPYKNLPHLIRTFRQLPARNVFLVIAGAPSDPALIDALRAAAGSDPRVQLHLRFIPAALLQRYLCAADLVVLPYREILNSGSAILALSFERPVLVPALGALPELQEQMGTAWVRTYAGELQAETLTAALTWALDTPREATHLFGALSWERIARQTLRAYQALER